METGCRIGLKEVSGTDASEATSFPYRKDIALAKNINADELLYGGPGEFTEQIVREFLLGEGDASSIPPEDREKFVTDSVSYFLSRIEQRGLPNVHLEINNTVPKEDLLKEFLLSVKKISDEQESIDVLVSEIFAQNTAVLPKGERMRLACKYALEHIPREVPSEIYLSYYLVLERITYSCEALFISLSSRSAEDFFYTLHLLSSGVLFETSKTISEEEAQKKFIKAMEQIITFLRIN